MRLRKRLSDMVAVDFFGASGREAADRLISGLVASDADDEARLAQGGPLFANLYQAFRRGSP
jgi:hypothetical protein